MLDYEKRNDMRKKEVLIKEIDRVPEPFPEY